MASSSMKSSSTRRFMLDLVCASEKAAQIARACRKEKDLFEMLIEEKTGVDKNARFAHDFKTLADVLIQETVRHDLGDRHPGLAEHILGEESASFTNTLGETIRVQVGGSEQETAKLLRKVLDGQQQAADILSRHVHSEPDSLLSQEVRDDLDRVPECGVDLDVSQLGVWIDPIDSTSSYIRGALDPGELEIHGDVELTSNGLQVVTVLIGVFERGTGVPVAGVINQPFARFDEKTSSWRGKVYWGLATQGQRFVSSSLTAKVADDGDGPQKVVVSGNEIDWFHTKVSPDSYRLCGARGAGYKLLCVARGLVDLYATASNSTYRWDSCAGHALLVALGGDVVQFNSRGEGGDDGLPSRSPLNYHEPNGDSQGVARWRNKAGVLAFRKASDAEKFIALFAAKTSTNP